MQGMGDNDNLVEGTERERGMKADASWQSTVEVHQNQG